jgi:hypothetical protein
MGVISTEGPEAVLGEHDALQVPGRRLDPPGDLLGPPQGAGRVVDQILAHQPPVPVGDLLAQHVRDDVLPAHVLDDHDARRADRDRVDRATEGVGRRGAIRLDDGQGRRVIRSLDPTVPPREIIGRHHRWGPTLVIAGRRVFARPTQRWAYDALAGISASPPRTPSA